MAQQLADALGLPYGSECVEDIALSAATGIYVVRLEQALQVFQCRPNAAALRALFDSVDFQTALKMHGNKLSAPTGLAVVAANNGTVTGNRGKDADIISRFFTVWRVKGNITKGIIGSNDSNIYSPVGNNVKSNSYSFKGGEDRNNEGNTNSNYLIRQGDASRGSVNDVDSTIEEEDSVTCSMHSVVAPYMIRLRQGGKYKVGDRVRSFQASPRGGYMTCIIIGRKA
uniref:Uncharacterized protein n=1 Tax=Lygus hesperus TaxID=30085 RepID=A0A146MA14_LYGHE